MIVDKELNRVSIAPVDSTEWLQNAQDGVDFLLKNAQSNEVLLYANWGYTFVHGVFVPLSNVSNPDYEDLLHCNLSPSASWGIEHVSGGGEPDEMYLARPLDGCGCHSLQGGEKIIFSRHFLGVDKADRSLEVSQSLVHCLDLYWMEESYAFCRLDKDGDIEPVIRLSKNDRNKSVTILADDLDRYMAVADFALLRKFNFTRYTKGFSGWSCAPKLEERSLDLAYEWGVQSLASFASGVQIVRTKLTRDDLIRQSKDRGQEPKKYASFKAHDWKNRRQAVISCAPEALTSYFEPESPLPFQTTPAFFRSEVLQKYKADPEKYTLGDRSVSSRAGWELRTFDVNDEGQVHTYLCYLGDLPHSEQVYWASFNEWPRGPISKRALATDFEGTFTTVSDPLIDLKHFIKELEEQKPDWWRARGEQLHETLHYPLTTSAEEWSNAILALDQFLVEGLRPDALKRKLMERRIPFDPKFASLKLLETLAAALTGSIPTAESLTQPLKTLHFLRTKVKGHSCGSEKDNIVRDCRRDHGSLKTHFHALVTDCCFSLQQLVSDVLNPVFASLDKQFP